MPGITTIPTVSVNWRNLPNILGGHWWSNLQVGPVIVRVGDWVEVAVGVKVGGVYWWSVWLKLVASHHWTIFMIAVIIGLNLWWLHLNACITLWYISTINQELRSLLILIFKLGFFLLIKSRLKHHILSIMEVRSDRLIFRNILIRAMFFWVSSTRQVTYGFESHLLGLIIRIKCLCNVWIISRFFKHCSWLCMCVANLFSIIWIYFFNVSAIACGIYCRLFLTGIIWSKLHRWCYSTILIILINFGQASTISMNRLCHVSFIEATHFPLPYLELNLLRFPYR